MLKSQEIINPQSTLNRAAAEEPIFVLRGKDSCAAYAVRRWAHIAEQGGQHSAEKVAEARAFADVMAGYAEAMASN